MESKLYQKAFFAIIFLTLIAISFLIIKPFLTALLTGIVFSYIFYPIYGKILKRIPNKNASAFIASLLVILVITIPLFFVLNTVSKEAYATYILSKQKSSNVQLLSSECQPADKSACKLMHYFAEKASDPQLKYYLDTTIKEATTRITGKISDILVSIPVFVLHMFITLFIMFFLFRDGHLLINKVERLLPLKEKYRKRVINKLGDMTYAVIYGSIIIAIIQGTLGGIGFFIFGLPTPLLWGLVMIFASFIPYVGSTIIWLPAALSLILNGYTADDPTFIIKGVLLIIYGIFVVGTIDNILKPKIIGDKSGLHPVLVLLGVVGGLQLLGFIGVMIGPILLALLVAFVNIYEEEKE
ncbi:AI-2E family transporter [Candidatus Woesearchaeota archaeon]|nr:AI-2E family transporter [Candidatus Woesearchaeota archaeon]